MPRRGTRVATAAVALFIGACNDESPTAPDGAQFAVAYVNADTGLATANGDVTPGSGCAMPDQEDSQPVGAAGTTNRNVHVDACLAKGRGGAGDRLDAQASFEVAGAGTILACPDPDGDGLKSAVNTGSRCTQSGFQTRNLAGDREYHLRVNNTSAAGDTTVTFCYDPEGDGCANAIDRSRVLIHWVAATAQGEAAPFAHREAAGVDHCPPQ